MWQLESSGVYYGVGGGVSLVDSYHQHTNFVSGFHCQITNSPSFLQFEFEQNKLKKKGTCGIVVVVSLPSLSFSILNFSVVKYTN